MPDIERYTPAQLEDEVQSLAEGYVSAVNELETDTEIFEDISEAIQSKTGQVEPYEKDELAGAIDGIVVDPNENLDAYIQGDLTDIVFNGTQIKYSCFRGGNLTSIVMPNVTSIGGYAFYDCSNLAIAFLSDSINSIGGNAFYNTKIAITKLPESLSVLAAGVFQNCKYIENLKINAALSSIYGNAFTNCTNLLTVDLSENNTIIAIQSTSFNNTTCTFLFRDQTQLDAYAAATNWSALADRFQIKGE